MTAAKLIGEIAGADRFATDAKLARTGGAAPIPASSGNTNRHRLDRGGNRQLNCALHRLAVNKGTWDPTPPPTSPASKSRANHAEKPSAASNATSPAASGNSSGPNLRSRPALEQQHHQQQHPTTHHRQRPLLHALRQLATPRLDSRKQR